MLLWRISSGPTTARAETRGPFVAAMPHSPMPWISRCIGVAVKKCPDQVQKCLMLGILPPSAQELTDLDVDQVTPRWGVGFMPDKHAARLAVAGKKPLIAIRAAVNLSFFQRHARLPDLV